MVEKIQARQEDILRAATEFFAALGYRNTDVQRIADTLQIGKGTIYRYFQSKEELFFASCDRAMNMMEEYVRGHIRDAKSDIERVRLAIRSYIEFYLANPHFAELFIQERAEFRRRDVPTYLSHRAKLDTEWKAMFERLYAEQKMRVPNFDRVIDYVSRGLYGIMFTNVFIEKRPNSGSRIDEAIDMLLYGILEKS
jgi:AcrR family transcriptional regulator